jgi:hypothetical protein
MNRRDVGTYAFAGAAAMATFYGAPSAALAQDAALGPVLAVISHPVADLAAWRVVYDAAQPVRDVAGVSGAEVLIDAANPLLVVIMHRFASKKAAQGFFNWKTKDIRLPKPCRSRPVTCTITTLTARSGMTSAFAMTSS